MTPVILTDAKSNTDTRKASQAKVLTEGGDLREAQVDIPQSVIQSCV